MRQTALSVAARNNAETAPCGRGSETTRRIAPFGHGNVVSATGQWATGRARAVEGWRRIRGIELRGDPCQCGVRACGDRDGAGHGCEGPGVFVARSDGPEPHVPRSQRTERAGAGVLPLGRLVTLLQSAARGAAGANRLNRA